LEVDGGERIHRSNGGTETNGALNHEEHEDHEAGEAERPTLRAFSVAPSLRVKLVFVLFVTFVLVVVKSL
jgi:hypothetical protein